VEVGVADAPSSVLAVARLGYASRAGDERYHPVTVGIGVRLGRVTIDYSYHRSDALGPQNRFSVAVGR
jgi:hypothetical protein